MCRFTLMSSIACLVMLTGGCTSTTSAVSKTGTLITDPGRLVGNPRCEKNVARIVTIWEPANGKGLNDRNSRGFAGQILFFGPGCETGGRVRGKVMIYEYDHFDKFSDEEPTLLHAFAFEPDAWEAHRTEGTLGHSYSVFIPYMNSHKDQVNCALKVELITDDGRKISSDETEVLLPGKNTASAAAARTRGFVHENRLGPDPSTLPVHGTAGQQEADRMETVSIPLPKR